MKSILILFSFALLTIGAGNVALASEVCDGKDMQTCYELGVSAHENGDFFTAAKHYRKACYGDYKKACHAVKPTFGKEYLEELEEEYAILMRMQSRACISLKLRRYKSGDWADTCYRETWEANKKICDRGDMIECFFLVSRVPLN